MVPKETKTKEQLQSKLKNNYNRTSRQQQETKGQEHKEQKLQTRKRS